MSMASLIAPLPLSERRLTNDEARRISKLIARLPELVEIERDQNIIRSRRKPQPLRFKRVTVSDLIRYGKLLEVHCGTCRSHPLRCAASRLRRTVPPTRRDTSRKVRYLAGTPVAPFN
jgi:hypothetical protein